MLLPAVTGLIVGLMLGPLATQADRLRIPSVITAITLTLLVIGIFNAVIVILAAPIGEWIGKAPEIGASIRQKMSVLDRPLESFRQLREAVLPASKDEPGVNVDLLALLQPVVLFVTPAIGQIVIFFGTLFFYLLGRNQVRRTLVVFFEARESRLRMLRIINDIEHSLTHYLSIVAVINTAVGLAAFVIAYLVGLAEPARVGRARILAQLHSIYRRLHDAAHHARASGSLPFRRSARRSLARRCISVSPRSKAIS